MKSRNEAQHPSFKNDSHYSNSNVTQPFELLKDKATRTKKTLILFILIIGFGVSTNAQSEKTNYVGINLIPIYGNTVELGYELNPTPNFSFGVYGGYVFNSKLQSLQKKGTPFRMQKKSGFFVKTGARYNVRKEASKFAPFLGINLVNAISIEEAIYDHDFDENTQNVFIARNSYNLGINGVIGITSPSTKRLNFDLGVQFGTTLINNLVDYNSYMPGMGVRISDGLRVQGILRVKYLIN